MNPDFDKTNGLLPVIIQDFYTMQVLMLGYMNRKAFEKTQEDGLVTFYSRSRAELWTKGETSGNYLNEKKVMVDCDNDTILKKAVPTGPVCHIGTVSCFADDQPKGYLYTLQNIIDHRISNDTQGSYTNSLYKSGINKVAQKVGEEAIELVIEAKDDNAELFKNEAADLLYHFLILLRAKEIKLEDVEMILRNRN